MDTAVFALLELPLSLRILLDPAEGWKCGFKTLQKKVGWPQAEEKLAEMWEPATADASQGGKINPR